jgi:pimeloyl-ACP methyl ester carboxylesterase
MCTSERSCSARPSFVWVLALLVASSAAGLPAGAELISVSQSRAADFSWFTDEGTYLCLFPRDDLAASPVVYTAHMPLEDHQIELLDGRQLGYVEAGDPDGHPIFYFHGFPGSRLEIELSGVDVAPLGARLIGVDRPGMGLSDFAPHRRFGDWPEDVSQLADALGLDHFSVVGVSGGGPYVAACALKLHDRLESAGIVCGVGPMNVPGSRKGMSVMNRVLFGLSRPGPWLAWVPTWVTARVLDAPTEKFQQRMARTLPIPDSELIEQRPDIAETLRRSAREAFRSGSRGVTHESVLYARRWDFRLEDIPMKVHLWQGELDRNVSPAMGHHQAAAIPDCTATFFPEEGHLSLPVNHMDSIVRELMTPLVGSS